VAPFAAKGAMGEEPSWLSQAFTAFAAELAVGA